MGNPKIYTYIGCLVLGSLFIFSCSQTDEPTAFEIIEEERPSIEAYVAAQGLEGAFNLQGVYVVVEAEGDTASSFPTSSNQVEFAFVGSLLDGQIFANTRGSGFRTQAGELPRLIDLISGLESGLKSFRIGGKGTLIIPSPLAYESYGSTDGSIPPNAILRFDLELLDIQ